MKIYIISYSKDYEPEITGCKWTAEKRREEAREFLNKLGEKDVRIRIRAVELKTQGPNFCTIAQETTM